MSETSPISRPRVLEFEEGRQIVIDTVRPSVHTLRTEAVTLDDAYGRILAESVRAERDYPALARSLRDGYAVRAADVPGTLTVRGEVRAGDQEQSPLRPGEALEIMTGAPVPSGADAVVMVEHVTRSGERVQIDQSAEAGQFINQRGAEAVSGTELIPSPHPARRQPHRNARHHGTNISSRFRQTARSHPGHW